MTITDYLGSLKLVNVLLDYLTCLCRLFHSNNVNPKHEHNIRFTILDYWYDLIP